MTGTANQPIYPLLPLLNYAMMKVLFIQLRGEMEKEEAMAEVRHTVTEETEKALDTFFDDWADGKETYIKEIHTWLQQSPPQQK